MNRARTQSTLFVHVAEASKDVEEEDEVDEVLVVAKVVDNKWNSLSERKKGTLVCLLVVRTARNWRFLNVSMFQGSFERILTLLET